MNEVMHINNTDISIKEYKGQRVVTFKDIDTVHGRPDGTARKRFADNRKHFVEGQDFFIATPQDLENIELSEKRTLENDVVSNRGTALITEQGYLMLVKSFTDDLAWEVQRQLVNGYFRARQLVADLSPQMKLLYGLCDQLAQAEREAKEAKQIADSAKGIAEKAVEATENIKDEMITPYEDWRDDINSKVREIAIKADIPYQQMFSTLYKELEQKAGCDLSTRQRNKRDRMNGAGCTKKEIDKETSKIAIIEEDKRIKQIFENIVRRYAMKYCA